MAEQSDSATEQTGELPLMQKAVVDLWAMAYVVFWLFLGWAAWSPIYNEYIRQPVPDASAPALEQVVAGASGAAVVLGPFAGLIVGIYLLTTYGERLTEVHP